DDPEQLRRGVLDEWSRDGTSSLLDQRRGGGRTVAEPGGHRGAAGLRPRAPGGSRRPRHLAGAGAVPARSLPDDVHHPAVDDPAVRRVLHRRGVQRVLPAQPRRRSEGPERRVRPRHPPRLRLRPPAGARRRRHGRRGDRLDLRHPHPLRRHPARHDERLDDDERRGAAGDGALHRGGRGAGRRARAARRDHPERHPQGVHGPQHLHLPAAAQHAGDQRHLRLHEPADAALQLHLDLRLPHAGGRGHGRPRARLHPRRRRGVHPGRARRGADDRPVRAAAELLLGDRDELLHGGRQDAGGAGAVVAPRRRLRPAEPEVAVPAHALPDVRLVAHGPGRVQQRRPHLHRGDGRDPGAHPVAAHQRARRGDRPPDRLLGADRPQHPAAAAAGVADHGGHRPLGGLLLRREAHPRPRGARLGPHPGGRAGRRDGQGDRAGHPQDAHRGGRCPHPGAHRLGRPEGHRRQHLPPRRGGPSRRAAGGQRRRLPAAARQARAPARRARRRRRTTDAGRDHVRRGVRRGQPARARRRRGAGQGDRRGDLRRHGEGVGSPPGGDPYDLGRVPRGVRQGRGRQGRPGAPRHRRVRGRGGPAPPHPGRQDGPGRPRPRPEGGRHRLRRPRVRRGRRSALLDPGGGRAAGGGRGRAHRRRQLARGGPPHPAPGAEACARRPGTPRHHDRHRRRHPARRRADPGGDGRGGGVPARHGDRRVGAGPAGPAARVL
ncbi:MAG: Methylmalonyl-CoA mutase large subunit, MutB, partial [uncultured Nocardioides sp.]